MKLEIKEIDGVPVTGIPDGSRTDNVQYVFYTAKISWNFCIILNLRTKTPMLVLALAKIGKTGIKGL